jgi:hypothetical protein
MKCADKTRLFIHIREAGQISEPQSAGYYTLPLPEYIEKPARE